MMDSQANGPCARVRVLFSTAADGEIAVGDRDFFFSHLKQCPACDREYILYQKALHALRMLRRVPASAGFEGRVLGAVSAESVRGAVPPAESLSGPTQPVALARPARLISFRAAAAAAAIVGVAVGLATYIAARRPGAPALPLPPPGMVQIGERIVPADRFVAETLEARGLVLHQGRWVSREEAAAIARGETWYRGRWRTSWELSEAIRSEPAQMATAQPPTTPVESAAPTVLSPPAPPPTPPPVEELLQRLGYVKAGDRWVTPQDKEWLDKGFIQYRDRWVSAEDLRREVLNAEGLVLHDGRWMTREERERLLATIPLPPAPASHREALAAAFKSLDIGLPESEGLLTAYPLYTRYSLPEEPWVSLGAALQGGAIEFRDERQTRRLKVRNAGARPAFLLAGELLAGGHQDRVIARDALVPPDRAWRELDVYCVEPGRSVGRPDRFDAPDALAPPDLRRLLALDAGQTAVWSAIRRRLDAASVKSVTDTLCALYARGPAPERLAAIERRLGDLPTRDARTVGVALAFGDGLAVAECFASNTLLRHAWPKILAAAAAVGVGRPGPGAAAAAPDVPNSRAGVNLLLESALRGEWVPAGGGTDAKDHWVRSGDFLFGEVSMPEGRLGHAALFVDGSGAAASSSSAAYALDKNKAQRLAVELARVMATGGDAARVRAVREFGVLPWVQTADTLAGFVAVEAAEPVRMALAEALGATRSPAAVKPLIDLLDKASRGGPAARAAALALARAADPRAIDPLFKLLHQSDVPSALIGLDSCAVLIASFRERSALDRAMSRFVAYFESLDMHILETDASAARCPTHPLYLALYDPMRAAIAGLSAVPIASGAHARQWWNRNREPFLRSRENR